MGLFLKALPLIIQLVEALIGRGKGPKKLGIATDMAGGLLQTLAKNGDIPEGAAHETGRLHELVHNKVIEMKNSGQLPNLEEEQKTKVEQEHFDFVVPAFNLDPSLFK